MSFSNNNTSNSNIEPEVLVQQNSTKRHIFPRLPGKANVFDYKAIPDEKARENFRFTYLELVRVTKDLGFEGKTEIRATEATSKHVFYVLGLEAIVIVLARLARPTSYAQLESVLIDNISDTNERLREVFDRGFLDGHHYHLYGDKGYMNTNIVAQSYSMYEVNVNPIYQAGNDIMKPLRVVVEWEIGHVKTFFPSFKLEDSNKLGESRLAMEIHNATLFKNIQVCLKRRNETSLICQMPCLFGF
ncbi:hypothetical protein BD770DRAFT_101732 [Pilaira anomala]|nr:hypothetical protein BD770DRAFT_101732 [Pilaira anomala]